MSRRRTTATIVDEPSRPAVGTVLQSAERICARRGERVVLDGVDVTVRAGELVALVGPNGAGKSTLLDVLTGDVAVASGEIRLLDRPMAEWSEAEVARVRAVLPQRPTVGFPFTVTEVVRMGRAPWHRSPQAVDDDRRVAECMATVEVTHLAGRSVLSLSGGEAARVALARVLAQDTPLLLLDEPTAALDIHHEELTLRAVRARVVAGAGAVVVLHDLALAAAHADRVVVLSAGRVAASGAPTDVLLPDLLSDVYRHPVDVVPHPTTGSPLVLPRR